MGVFVKGPDAYHMRMPQATPSPCKKLGIKKILISSILQMPHSACRCMHAITPHLHTVSVSMPPYRLATQWCLILSSVTLCGRRSLIIHSVPLPAVVIVQLITYIAAADWVGETIKSYGTCHHMRDTSHIILESTQRVQTSANISTISKPGIPPQLV